MPHCYSVFGLDLVANNGIPGLLESGSPFAAPDVEIHLSSIPDLSTEILRSTETIAFTSSILSSSGEPVLQIYETGDGLFRLEYHDGTRFWLDREGKDVWIDWGESSSIEDAATYLLGPVLGFLMRLRGVTCLHASAVAIGDFAVAFAGVEGAGKSTTAAALAKRGHAVISDDVVALAEHDGAFFVLPAYPYLCLWPDSVSMIYGPDKTLPPFSPNFEKRQLALCESSLRFETQQLSLGAIYLLGERSAEERAPYVETPAPRESLLSLIADTYATKLLDANMRAREFEVLGRLLGKVPVLRLRPHQEGRRLSRLCELIERSTAGRPGITAPAISATA